MRRILIGTLSIAALAFSTSAMAQTTPVPGGSGSQVTNPQTYRDTAKRDRERSMLLQQRKMGLTTGSVKKRHVTKKRHSTAY
ncbi:hypothetical protein [Microvirga sp. G4-2]|uniref:hypothetical protein n=1 Tax=Microvirga sp. G4-2 TaxID=3434467 RepID=UPI00404444FB